jgi:hypothetical protein
MGTAVPLFRGREQSGYLPEISANPRRVMARKRPFELQVEFAPESCLVQTPEGKVHAQAGDAIVTGTVGERWSVSPARFGAGYTPVPPTVAGQSGRYRTRPIEVLAVPMTGPFDVLLSDGRSRLHGQRGDWLVDYGDGSLGVVAKSVFATTYEVVR